MKTHIEIPSRIESELRAHFFQSDVEQGAFLFASARNEGDGLRLDVVDLYLVPPEGWEVQMDVYLQMSDAERARIMKLAREKDLCAIDCHSHPNSGGNVWFSPSDVAGITEFAQYAKWKLGGKPFAAMVWGEDTLDAVVWRETFLQAEPVGEVRITGLTQKTYIPTASWFTRPRGKHRFETYD